jgi:ketosteroid isomerase-like protein
LFSTEGTPFKKMKMCKIITTLITFIIFCITAIQLKAQQKDSSTEKELYKEILKMDSIFFTAYNNCDMDKQTSIYADSIEFYHDKGGLSTSKKDILEATKKNICGKVTRTLIKGSIEVYPINNYGAVEIGLHKFHNNQKPESNQPKEGSKFIIIWHKINSDWKISRVVSLH